MQKQVGRIVVILVVLLSYTYFLSKNISFSDFNKTPKANAYYASLTEGFLHGQLSMSIKPSPKLLQLKDPYKASENKPYRLTDVSFFNGKYYLYFGPLPIIVFIMPFKLLTGLYPPDSLSIFFFITIGFLANFILLIRIKSEYFPTTSENQLLFAGLIIGLATNSPFLLKMRFYELAVASAFCFVSLAILFLYGFFNSQSKIKNLLLFSLCLSLAVAGRPHFALVLFILIPFLIFYLLKHNDKSTFKHLLFALLMPAIFVAIGLCLYNYFRFGSFIDFGFRYQLKDLIPNGFKLAFIPYRLYIYFFRLSFSILGYPVPFSPTPFGFSKPTPIFEFTAGALTYAPFVLFSLFLPKIIFNHYRNKQLEIQNLCWFILFGMLIPLVIISYLSILSFCAQRYESDFLPYLGLFAIISWWFIIESHHMKKSYRSLHSLFITLGVMSILLSIKLASSTHLWVHEFFKSITLLLDDGNFFLYIYVRQHLMIINILPFICVAFYFFIKSMNSKMKSKVLAA